MPDVQIYLSKTQGAAQMHAPGDFRPGHWFSALFAKPKESQPAEVTQLVSRLASNEEGRFLMNSYRFDDRALRWSRFGDLEPCFYYSILHVDEKRRIIDVLFKFPANEQIVLHRHLALNHTFVVQGNHRLYETDGGLREDRLTGSYTVSPRSEKPHREGGGDQDVIIFFSIRPDNDEELYELLDDALNPIATITYQMLVELYQAQQGCVAA